MSPAKQSYRPWLICINTAQTDIKDVGSSSADDFLAREQALLGDDAAQFTTSNDSAAFGDASDDLLGGGGDASLEQSQFQNQFPDINAGNEVGTLVNPCFGRTLQVANSQYS